MSSQQPPHSITRNLSEFAVSDTPATTSGTEGSGSDYLDYRAHTFQQAPQRAGGGSGSGSGGVPTGQRERRGTQRPSGEGGDAGAVRQNENVDADEQMATLADGEVARAVERKAGTQKTAHGGGGMGRSSQSPHGRGRGQVTLEATEAGLERKKAQQEVARKQIMDARKRGVDVDGRGESGPSGRQPRAEID
ncbi:hypothetical protein MFIFM68171_11110 [Madurella fahalii]|uniref:Uncharacterized protein n=1 Tax=Madurella fahalii TaxID=1157608 RepID=A0ABQ0GT29_9PEZI